MVPWQAIFLVIMNQFVDTRATVNLASSVNGRRACPKEVVTYTCTGTGIGILEWIAEPFLQDDGTPQSNTILYTTIDTGRVGQAVDCTNRPMQDCAGFQATLTSIDVLMVGVANMISTLTVTATAMLNETVVQCSGTTTAGTLSATSALSVTSLPSPALFQTPSYTVQEYDRDNVTIRVLWEPPQDGGGASVVNYTITISPGLDPLTTTATSAVVTIPYNVMHTVSIVVTNCNGSSGAATETTPAIVGCGAPSPPENGSVQPLDICQSTQQGSQIFFSCNTSYAPAGYMISMCASDGMWNPNPATFVCIFDCGPPPAPRNGSLESYTDTTEGSVVFYSCDRGLVPEGRMTSACTLNGWNPNPGALSCSVVNCGMPTAPLNGSIVTFSGSLVGAETVFMCAPGFVPAGKMRAVCTSDGVTVNGTWTPDPATLMCNVGCGPPTTPWNGSLESYSDTTVDSVVFYRCNPGLVPEGRMRAMCTENGWSPNPGDLNCFEGSICGSCSTGFAVTAVVSCAVTLIIGALVGAVVHYSLTIACKQQKQQPAPLYGDIVEQKGTVDPTHIELRENTAYGQVQN